MAYQINDKCIGCGVCKKVCPTKAIEGKRSGLHKVIADLCIDCGACGRVCPQEAILDEHRNVCQRIRFRSRWEKPQIDRNLCISCNACIDACPVDCLGLTFTEDTADRRVFPYLEHPPDCIACRFCQIECPVDAVKMVAPAA